MLEIDSKRKLKSSEGAHFFFTLIFLVFCLVIKHNYKNESCNQNLDLFVNFIYYGLIIWMTYLLIIMIARCRNQAIRWLFAVMDIFLGVLIFACLIWGLSLYNSDTSDCQTQAPIHYFFLALFVYVVTIIFSIMLLATIAFYFRLFFQKGKFDSEEVIAKQQ